MTTPKLPQTDSIQELAEFWDTHDLTDFEDELEDVGERVFRRDNSITVLLSHHEANALERMAEATGVSREQLVRAWLRERITQSGDQDSTQTGR